MSYPGSWRAYLARATAVASLASVSSLLVYYSLYHSVKAQPAEVPSALSPSESVTLEGSAEMWRKRALSWYKTPDVLSRRRQMRDMSRPLKRPCYYCHTRSFKGYVDETYLISLQMMAISAEQGVRCAECHQGKRGLTALGAKSLIQWRSSVERGQDCNDCHQPQGRFQTLTPEGLKARGQLIDELPDRGRALGVSAELIDSWSRELRREPRDAELKQTDELRDVAPTPR